MNARNALKHSMCVAMRYIPKMRAFGRFLCVFGSETNKIRCCFSGSWFFFLSFFVIVIIIIMFSLFFARWLSIYIWLKLFRSNVNGDKFMWIELWLCHHFVVHTICVFEIEIERKSVREKKNEKFRFDKTHIARLPQLRNLQLESSQLQGNVLIIIPLKLKRKRNHLNEKIWNEIEMCVYGLSSASQKRKNTREKTATSITMEKKKKNNSSSTSCYWLRNVCLVNQFDLWPLIPPLHLINAVDAIACDCKESIFSIVFMHDFVRSHNGAQ